jgi:hypothetical protein
MIFKIIIGLVTNSKVILKVILLLEGYESDL